MQIEKNQKTGAEKENDTRLEEEDKTVSFAEQYYDRVDRSHAEILEKCAKMCRSNKHRFTDDTKIKAIRSLLVDSGYTEVYINSASVWYKGDLTKLKDCYLVSSHADLVENIKKPSSKLSDDGYFKGTYDNIGTNAAAVIAMLEGDLPDNVVFSFTADEETGNCKGAKDTLTLLASMGIKSPTCIALDVTYEGYDEGMLASVENCSKNIDFLHLVASAALMGEPEGKQSFCFVRKSKKAIPDNLPEGYISRDTGMYDEAVAYSDMGCRSFSLCLPCDGHMHSDTGLMVRQPAFEGYVNTLESMLYALTHTHENLIEAKKIEKVALLERQALLLEAEKQKRKQLYNTHVYGGYNQMYFPEDEMDYYKEDAFDMLCDDAEEFKGVLLEIIADNIYGYDKADREIFVIDMISMIAPDLYEQYQTLADYIGSQFDEYKEEVENEEIEGYLEDFY